MTKRENLYGNTEKKKPGRPRKDKPLTTRKRKSGVDALQMVGVDVDPSLYELTDLFYSYYKYHNESCVIDYDEIVSVNLRTRELKSNTKTMPRFAVLRRIEACRLGSRPFLAGDGIAASRPNVSFGYMSLFLTYLALPFKSILSENNFIKIRVNKKLYDTTKLSEQEKMELKTQAANNPNMAQNAEVGDDVTDAFADIIKLSKKCTKWKEQLPRRVTQDGLGILLHSDMEWAPDPIQAIDLVTEPQASWDPDSWTCFFVIRKMTAQEAVKHIREKTPFWEAEALQWSLESAVANRGILDRRHHTGLASPDDKACGENFMVQSFFQEKSTRRTNIGSYYGNMFVVEAYYMNSEGKVDKAIFFPSTQFQGVSADIRQKREAYRNNPLANDKPDSELEDTLGADVLYFRKNVFDKMSDAITVIPADRAEPSLERQRFYGHELFAPIESVMRLDTSLMNMAMLAGVPFTKNRVQGTDAQDLQDLEINVNGEMTDLGDRDFVTVPFQADLNAIGSIRNLLLQHVAAKAFLGGLDGQEMTSSGRGAQLANLRLVRDGRVHKHHGEDFSSGLKEGGTKMFRRVLDLNKRLLADDNLLKRKFFQILTEVQGHPETLFEFKAADILEDTDLPYWMSLDVVRNGGSHFGAAEIVLLTEVKNMVSDGLDQRGLQSLNRMVIKSLLGQEDAIDILGDPKDALVTDQDQVYRARMENASILGSVDQGALNYEEVIILPDKDDHVTHLTQAHLPKMEQILQLLSEGDVTPDTVQELTEDQLNTRTNLILKLAALASHTSMHLDMLDRFGAARDDVNQLKEQGNNIMQAAEGLLNSLQINLRALQAKRQEKEMRLQNMSPENEIEREKLEVELAKIQAQKESDKNKLMLANKIADQKQVQHMDKQVSKARDRELKKQIATRDTINAREDRTLYAQELADTRAANSFGGGGGVQ